MAEDLFTPPNDIAHNNFLQQPLNLEVVFRVNLANPTFAQAHGPNTLGQFQTINLKLRSIHNTQPAFQLGPQNEQIVDMTEKAFRRSLTAAMATNPVFRLDSELIVQVTYIGHRYGMDNQGNFHLKQRRAQLGVPAFIYPGSDPSKHILEQTVGQDFDPAAYVNFLLGIVKQDIGNVLDEKAAIYGQGHNTDTSSHGTTLFIYQVNLTFGAAPPGHLAAAFAWNNLHVGCTPVGKKNKDQRHIQIAYVDSHDFNEPQKVYLQSVATSNNNCLIYALTINSFYTCAEVKFQTNAKYGDYLNQQKFDYLRWLLKRGPTGVEMASPLPLDYTNLCRYFKVHIVCFKKYLSTEKRFMLQLMKDTRLDPDITAELNSRKAVKFVIEEKEHGMYHVLMILNDEESIYFAVRRLCPICNISFLADPETGEAKKHLCNKKKAEMNKARIEKFSMAPSPMFKDPMQPSKIEWDDNTDLTLTRLNSTSVIPAPNFKLGTCPYLTGNRLCFIDLEVYFGAKNQDIGEVYAVGVYCEWNETYRSFYGRTCLAEFLQYVAGFTTGVCFIAYNGSRFDMLFLARQFLLNPRYEVTDYLINNAELLSMTIRDTKKKNVHHKIWDLCKFTLSSLRDACKTYGTHSQKTFFPHKMVTDWDVLYYRGPQPGKESYFDSEDKDLSIYLQQNAGQEFDFQKICLEYLKLDVMSLKEVFWKVQDYFNKIYEAVLVESGEKAIHLTSCISLSQLSYSICRLFWKKDQVELFPPADIHAYNIFQSGYIGGRVESWTRDFEVPNFESIMKDPTPEKYESIQEHLMYMDVTSLYPFAMMGGYFPYGAAYFVDNHVIQEIQEILTNDPKDFLQTMAPFLLSFLHPGHVTVDHFTQYVELPLSVRLLCSYWEIEFTPPPNSPITCHLFRASKGKLCSDLYSNRGWYYSPDVFAMIDCGYKIVKIHHIIAWEKFGRILKRVIEFGKIIKDTGANGKWVDGVMVEPPNAIMKTIGKLFLNSLYGKFGQTPKPETFKTIYSAKDLLDFTTDNIWTETCTMKTLPDEKGYAKPMLLVKGQTKEDRILTNLPTYLAAFVTAWSRMNNYFSVFKPIFLNPERPLTIKGSLHGTVAYHDTDSFVISSKDLDRLEPFLLVHGEEKFGQLKDEVRSKCKEASKIIKFLCVGKKCYYMVYLTESGKTGTLQACKGISEDIPFESFQAIATQPRESTFHSTPRESMNKRFVTLANLGSVKKARLEKEIEERLKTSENTVSDMMDIQDLRDELETEIQDTDYETNLSFTISMIRDHRRTLNKNPSHDKAFNPDTCLYEYYSPNTTPETIQFNNDFTGSSYERSWAKRSRYKKMATVNLSTNRLVAMVENNRIETMTEEFEEEEFVEPDFGMEEYDE